MDLSSNFEKETTCLTETNTGKEKEEVKDEDNCSICYENITSSTGRTILSCSHNFHVKCIAEWFQQTQSDQNCPLCRNQLTPFEKLTKEVLPVERDIVIEYRHSYIQAYKDGFNRASFLASILIPGPTIILGMVFFSYYAAKIAALNKK
jgi:hypothetical protein